MAIVRLSIYNLTDSHTNECNFSLLRPFDTQLTKDWAYADLSPAWGLAT